MASNITLSAGVRQNLLSLQSTASLMALTQNRLATGKKVNSALDNPSNFFTSQALSNRASDLNALLDSIGQAQKTLEAADKGLTSLTKLVESAKSIAKQAQQTTASGTTYSNAITGNAAIAADSAAVATGTVNLGTDAAAVGTGTVAIAADTAATLTGTVGSLTTGTTLDIAGGGLTTGQTITVSDGTNTNTFTVGATPANDDINDVLTALNGGSATWTASVNGSGQLEVVSNNTNDTITVSGTAASALGFGVGNTTASATNATIGALTGTLTVQQGSGATTTVDFSTVKNRTQLLSALGAIGSIDGSNHLVLTASNNTDSITVGGTARTGLGLNTSYDPTNSVIGALTGTLTVQQGSGATTTVDFSTVKNSAQLLTALGSAGSIDGSNHLVLTASNATDSFTIGGTARTGLGLAASAGPSNSTLSGLSGTLTVKVGSAATQTLTFGSGNITTRAQLSTALSGLSGVTASINGSNQISITSSTSDYVVIGGTDAASFFAAGNIGTNSPTATVGTPNATRASLQTQYNDLLTQIDSLAKDASYNGVNLLNGDNLKVVFNETGTSSQTITGVTFTSTGLGLTSLSGSEFQTNAGVDTIVGTIDAALSSLRTQASKFGSNLTTVQTRQDFTKQLVNTLQTGADNLVLADTNEEGANLLALQTRQQLSSTALSLSAQADQAVLRLFG
jgi:flagellin-like hook-associated protein FlgL